VPDAILVLNAGSSSLKFEVFAVAGAALARRMGGGIEELTDAPKFAARDARGTAIGEREWPAGEALGHDGALAFLLDWLRQHGEGTRIVAVGHRVVHGGAEFSGPYASRPTSSAACERRAARPLHQPANIQAITAVAAGSRTFPGGARHGLSSRHCARAGVRCRALSDDGVRRYGFHGLSYEYIASVLPRHDPRASAGRTVVLHLRERRQHARCLRTERGDDDELHRARRVPMRHARRAVDPGVLL
jgi:acetate kinase